MTKVILLERLREFTQAAVGELLLPVRAQKAGEKAQSRPAAVYLMRLPDGTSAVKKAPYILHQALTGKDAQSSGHWPEATATVRSVFCVYSENEQEGGLALLGLMERLRVELLKRVVIGRQFELDLQAGLETLLYTEDTAPYYLGEMLSVWKLPAIEREVSKYYGC